MRPKVGDTVSFREFLAGKVERGEIVIGRVSWVGMCGVDVMVGDDCVTIDEEDIVPNPAPRDGS